MTQYDDIKGKIRKRYGSLPKNQKKIADFIVENFDRVPFLNVQEMAASTASSVASIVRFAQRTGFEGYKELQEEIGSSLQDRLQHPEVFTLPSHRQEKDDILTLIAQQDVKNINNTLQLIERSVFDRSIKTILKARHVYTAGLGISYLLAEVLSYQLNQVGVSSSALRQGSTSFAEQILYFQPNDVLIVFSFPPYSQETIDAAHIADEKGNTVIAITNKENAPVTFSADSSLLVKSENMLYTNSFAAISVLINAISTQCAMKDKARAETMLAELDAIMKKTTVQH
ncbi:MAG: MurR/RpiR family transcriptional regulator [Bacteroidetes bacterium]|nr:MurR/RpiR family transcriptional regulator [Bacteroidota bacterium]